MKLVYVIVKTLGDCYPEVVKVYTDRDTAQKVCDDLQDDYDDSMWWDYRNEWTRYQWEVEEAYLIEDKG